METISRIRPRRKIQGMSAILLPLTQENQVDWQGFEDHVARTAAAGLVPTVNMDTGYANLISEELRVQVLSETKRIVAGGPYVAGAFVGDQPGDAFNEAAYCKQVESIQQHGGTPILFQSYGLTQQNDDAIVSAYEKIAAHCDTFYAFELGTMFAPFGKIYSLDVYAGLMQIAACLGAKHSSLSRDLEWQRLDLRDAQRADFRVLTGNDLAIDMVMYGSDYLLGLSTFAPEAFARRDRMWEEGDSAFYELNDLLQYLGMFAFRDPVPAYKHNAAQFLHLRGWIETANTFPGSPTRPESDVAILKDILDRLETEC
ncbi:hypothetical protein FF011L_20640 [Roseimaritima multifibrata]|uniref:Dihydrodipicolinate synthase family protein n=1 Tax=Roseimaritima multifibrata TaxID=1930274 RepID=A0A517MEI5_9BACT|nr:dihydrodipicolinate synthase family protein [Roseimaritima multifibrata]QDS93302.1 hypothetical protein FF011L_20640 [Roseimaritima multifibrata]